MSYSARKSTIFASLLTGITVAAAFRIGIARGSHLQRRYIKPIKVHKKKITRKEN
jgi:hypothetical protein